MQICISQTPHESARNAKEHDKHPDGHSEGVDCLCTPGCSIFLGGNFDWKLHSSHQEKGSWMGTVMFLVLYLQACCRWLRRSYLDRPPSSEKDRQNNDECLRPLWPVYGHSPPIALTEENSSKGELPIVGVKLISRAT